MTCIYIPWRCDRIILASIGITPVATRPYYRGVHFTAENSVMNQQLRKILRGIIVCFSVSAIVYCYCINADRGSGPKLPVVSVKRAAFSGDKKIMYLLQAESCLPLHLRLVDVMGNTSICKCDVLVLSYKKPCNDIPYHYLMWSISSTHPPLGQLEGICFMKLPC